MTAKLLDGKNVATTIRTELKTKIETLNSTDTPILAVIKVGDNEASKIYVRNKHKAANEIGIGCNIIELADTIGENALLETINDLNDNPHINGIIVQLPLPKHIDTLRVLSQINPDKDVDGFSPYNTGLLSYNNQDAFISATPKGVLRLLQTTGIDLNGKHAVIIGRSNIVGKPLSMLLLNHNCTVTITHSQTKNLPSITQTADIVIAACGKANMVKSSWIKKDAIIIDVGINRNAQGKLCGDVDFNDCIEKASYITPVPGGVGPMTIAMLLSNTYDAFLKQQNLPKIHCCNKKCCNH